MRKVVLSAALTAFVAAISLVSSLAMAFPGPTSLAAASAAINATETVQYYRPYYGHRHHDGYRPYYYSYRPHYRYRRYW